MTPREPPTLAHTPRTPPPVRRTPPGRAAGQSVKAGDILLSIEAMKMETALHAKKDGTVTEVLVGAGEQIDAKGLLVVYQGEV